MQYIQHAHTHAFNGLFYGTIWVSWYQKGIKPVWINDARDDGVLGWQCHQLDHMQTICTSLQTDKHTNTPSLNFTGRMLFPMHNQLCQSTEGKAWIQKEQDCKRSETLRFVAVFKL